MKLQEYSYKIRKENWNIFLLIFFWPNVLINASVMSIKYWKVELLWCFIVLQMYSAPVNHESKVKTGNLPWVISVKDLKWLCVDVGICREGEGA